jgi:DNA repair exonuclease SbcCD nuclease subunit
MKVAIISDLHFGVHLNSKAWLKSMINYFSGEFIETLQKEDISEVIILGDLFHNRNSVNGLVKDSIYELFDKTLKNFNFSIIIGNHDTFFKNTTKVHSLKFLSKFSNVDVIDDIKIKKFNNKEFLFVPWQVNNEWESDIPKADVLLGHFELTGFKLNNNKVCDFGMEPSWIFENYSKTFSGHVHERTIEKRGRNEIIYQGAPYHLSRHDIGRDRGMCILNTDDLSYKFIDSKTTIKYISITYPEIPKSIQGNIIDINIQIGADFKEKEYKAYLEAINEKEPLEVHPKPIYDEVDIDVSDSNEEVDNIGDAMTDFVNRMDISKKDKELINTYMSSKLSEFDLV